MVTVEPKLSTYKSSDKLNIYAILESEDNACGLATMLCNFSLGENVTMDT